MKIRLNIDKIGYMNKPQGATVATIRNRLCNASSIREIEPDQLIGAVQRGRSWTPAVMTGTTADTWQGQQIIAADVDNAGKDAEGNKVCIPDPLTPSQALEALEQYGIKPFFMYWSFSSAENWPRYRIVVLLDQALIDPQEAKDLTARLANVLNRTRAGCTDTTIADPARLLFGGRADSVFYQSGTVTSAKAMRKMPKIKKPEQSHTIRPTPNDAMMAGNDARIMDALNRIPCSLVSREEWIGVGMAIHALGWAFDVWDAWSATDPARYSQRVCEKTWSGFNKAGGIDHRYIIHLAQKHGWTAPRKQVPAPEPKEEKKQETTEATPEQTPANASQVVLMLKQYETQKYKPIPTGIKEIDDIINGGFFVQTLVTLGAPPAAGKTLIATQMFEGVAKAGRADVCYCNLEMPPEQLIARSLSRMTELDALKIMQGYSWNLKERDAIYKAATEYEQTIQKHFYYMPTKDTFYENIVEQITKVEEGRKDRELPFVTVIDYIQLLSSREKLDDVETIKRSLKAFKDFAMTRNAFVFLIMAHSRALNESGTVTQGAGRDTSSLEYSADIQLSINYRAIAEGKYKDRNAMKTAIKGGKLDKTAWSEYALVCTKNRFGRSGEYAGMRILGEKSMFEMMPDQKKRPRVY